MEEEHSQLKREHRDKCREHDQLKRLATRLKEELAVTQAELTERDRLIAEKGLVIVGDESLREETSEGAVNGLGIPKKALVSAENAQLLFTVGEGSLGKSVLTFYSFCFLLQLCSYFLTSDICICINLSYYLIILFT